MSQKSNFNFVSKFRRRFFFASGEFSPTSVADPGCLSRILIFTHPGSRIQKQQQKREVKKFFLSYLFM
jgi:hypothetical protein